MSRTAWMRRVFLVLVHSISTPIVVFVFTLCPPVTTAQSQTQSPQKKDFTRILGAEDGDLVVPGPVLTTVQKDSSALQTIAAFVSAVNGGGWSEMQATGTLTAPGATAEQYPATLTIQNGTSFRLDVNTPEGLRSTRIHGRVGRILESNGVKHSLPAATALVGLFAFPKLMMTTFPSTQTSVIDQGTIVVDGKSLLRVTVQEPVSPETTPQPANVQTNVIDLYFDPATHLLLKSVASVQLNTADRARYMQAVTYSDYQNVDGMLLPFATSQTLNGQRQWSLQLTNVQLNSSVDTSLFTF